MNWFQAHATLMYGIAIGLVVLVGAVLVSNKFATDSTSSQYTWGSYSGGGRFVPYESYDSSMNTPLPLEERFTLAELYRNLETNPNRTHASFVAGEIPLLANLKGVTTQDGVLDLGEGAIKELLASLKPTMNTGALGGDGKKVAYYYIPENFSPTPPTPSEKMTDAQRALYNYGNDAGSSIELYNSLWSATQAFVHRGFIEDRGDPGKAAEMMRLAEGLSMVSQSLKELGNVPPEVKARHVALADAYEAVAEKTRAIANAATDDTLLTAIENYNATVDKFLLAYLAVANVFTLNSVSFSPDEPGRVFVYSGESADQDVSQ